MRGSGEIHLTHLRARTFAEPGPDLQVELADALEQAGRSNNRSAEALQPLLPARRLGASHRGLIFHLDPARLALHLPETPTHLRALAREDQPARLALRERCSPQKVDDAYVDLGHEVVYGCFEAQQLVAAGSGYRRNGFLDIGVITDPAHRGRRLAPALAAAISRDGIQKGLTAQYRCDGLNASSILVAERAGFTRLFTYEVQEIRPGQETAAGSWIGLRAAAVPGRRTIGLPARYGRQVESIGCTFDTQRRDDRRTGASREGRPHGRPWRGDFRAAGAKDARGDGMLADCTESEWVLEIRSPMPAGQRVLFGLLALVPLLAPYELIVRVGWQSYFNLPFLFVAVISAGALALSGLLLWAAIAGLTSSIRIDKAHGEISYSASAPIVPLRTSTFPIISIERMQIAATEWSDSSPTYALEFLLAGGRSFRTGSSWSRPEMEALLERVAAFLTRPG